MLPNWRAACADAMWADDPASKGGYALEEIAPGAHEFSSW